MHLVYVDESGNSGANLNDPQQPVFVLCAMIVAEQDWQPLERELKSILDKRFPTWRETPKFEVHATDLRNGSGFFRGVSVEDRVALRDEWMTTAAKQGIKLIYKAAYKKSYAKWLVETFGAGLIINPHYASFALLAPCVDRYLQSLPGQPLGMFIFDENKQVMGDVEKSIKVLKDEVGPVKVQQIIEKGFFIDSKKSHPLQLCDLFALSLRKQQERIRKCGAIKQIDESGIALAEALVHIDHAGDVDVLAWLTTQHKPTTVAAASTVNQDEAQKNSGQGINPGVD